MTQTTNGTVPKVWSFQPGQTKANRVLAFERYPGAPLHLEWGKPPLQREKCLSVVTGAYPVRNRAVARELADRVAKQLGGGSGAHESFRSLAGLPSPPTVAQLYGSYLENRAQADWDAPDRSQDRRYRDFWCGMLGPERRIHKISFAEAAEAVRRASSRRGWSAEARQAHMTSIVEVFRFGHEEASRIHRLQLMSSADLSEPSDTMPTPRWVQAFGHL